MESCRWQQTRGRGTKERMKPFLSHLKIFIIQMTPSHEEPGQRLRTFVSHSRLMWNVHLDDVNNVEKTWERAEDSSHPGRAISRLSMPDEILDILHDQKGSRHHSRISPHIPSDGCQARMIKNVSLALSQGELEVVLWLSSLGVPQMVIHSYSGDQQFCARRQLEKVPH